MTAVLVMIFLTGCATVDVSDIGESVGETGATETVIAQTAAMPPLPPDCRKRERSGVVAGDRIDVALIKTDTALTAANNRVTRCAAWYDETRRQDR